MRHKGHLDTRRSYSKHNEEQFCAYINTYSYQLQPFQYIRSIPVTVIDCTTNVIFLNKTCSNDCIPRRKKPVSQAPPTEQIGAKSKYDYSAAWTFNEKRTIFLTNIYKWLSAFIANDVLLDRTSFNSITISDAIRKVDRTSLRNWVQFIFSQFEDKRFY